MTARREDRTRAMLSDAAQALTRAEQLIELAALQLGEPFQTALEGTAAAVARNRRRLKTQTLASCGTGGGRGE